MTANKFSAYLFARLAVGGSFTGHGLIRMPKLDGFSQWMTGEFSGSPLPQWLVTPFAYALPFAELALGLLLLVGLFSRLALTSASIIMLTLIFGSCMIENWSAVATQLFYSLYLAILLALHEYNRYSLDYKLGIA
ncbi:DoxX family membrane protein [Roseivirga sp. BDSF3-8]|uniref:DoxX family membrane protein n=1 Tax=Roseivirga sp. BDSF3-8 TaxID=3241598 RepID=UPI003532539B